MRFVNSIVSIFLLFLLGISTVFAGSMKFFPSTGNFGMYCLYSGEIRVDTNSFDISAIDARVFFKNIVLSSFTGLLSSGNYTHLGTLGKSLVAVHYNWTSYPSNSFYHFFNRYTYDRDHLLNVTNVPLVGYLFTSTGLSLTGSLDFYFIVGENLDDSNMQSSIVNGVSDQLVEINSGFYSFFPKPCIDDKDIPLFTGYVSGATYHADVHTGFYFTIYDYTGNHVVGYNSTSHYRFQSGKPDLTNLVNYVPVGSYDIDNQEGVFSGSVFVYLSGIEAIISGNLLPPTLLSFTGLDCSLPYEGEGYPLTWNQNFRGYTCFVPFTGLNFDTSQIVQVIITGSDYFGNIGILHFTFSYLKSGTHFTVKIYPGSRPGGNYANIGVLKFYDITTQFVSDIPILTDTGGVGSVQINQLPSGIYYVVYKGQSHLASYLSGVSVVAGNIISLDFTTGSALYNTQNKSFSEDDGNQYQIAGDLKNILGVYDYTINGNDIAILTMSGFIDGGIDVLDPKNLNADTAINVSDISVIGVNFELKDPFHPSYSGTQFIF